MKNVFKLFGIIALVAVIGFLMAACGPSETGTAPGTNPGDDSGNNPPQPPQTAAQPSATPASGEVDNNTSITLTTSTEGATIYFTQDGTWPSKESTQYSNTNKPLITKDQPTLYAIAVKDGMYDSEVLTETYTIKKVTKTVKVEFVPFPTLNMQTVSSVNFSPRTELPSGVTYILTDNKGHSWDSANGFNGWVTADNYSASDKDSVNGSMIYININFTQTFYLNGVEITGTESKRHALLTIWSFLGWGFSGAGGENYVMLTITE